MTKFYDNEDRKMYTYHKKELKRYLLAEQRVKSIFIEDTATREICLNTCEQEINSNRASMYYIMERFNTASPELSDYLSNSSYDEMSDGEEQHNYYDIG